MDIAYIRAREQVSLQNAAVAASQPARIAHQQLAKAYGDLLIEGMSSHRAPAQARTPLPEADRLGTWENEGGAGIGQRPVPMKHRRLAGLV